MAHRVPFALVLSAAVACGLAAAAGQAEPGLGISKTLSGTRVAVTASDGSWIVSVPLGDDGERPSDPAGRVTYLPARSLAVLRDMLPVSGHAEAGRALDQVRAALGGYADVSVAAIPPGGFVTLTGVHRWCGNWVTADDRCVSGCMSGCGIGPNGCCGCVCYGEKVDFGPR